MARTRSHIKRIEHIERATSSVNGNPAWYITFTDDTTARTMSDTACAYAVGNPDMRVGCLVVVEYTKSGRIRHMGPAKSASEEQGTMSEHKFYRTRITFDVLSEEPIHPYMDIAGIVAECDDGGYVMDSNQPNECVTVELSGTEMAQALHNAGSTPEFFQLDDAGNPIEEDDDGPS